MNYEYRSSSSKRYERKDMQGQSFSDSMYALAKLKQIIDLDNGSTAIEDMVSKRLITKNDIAALQKIAEVEQVDTSDIVIPELSSSDDEMPPLLSDNEDDNTQPLLTDQEDGYDTE